MESLSSSTASISSKTSSLFDSYSFDTETTTPLSQCSPASSTFNLPSDFDFSYKATQSPLKFPIFLPCPQELSSQRIDLSFDEHLSNVPYHYTLMKLNECGKELLDNSIKCKINLHSPSNIKSGILPSRIPVTYSEETSFKPNLILAVHDTTCVKTLLLPIHSLVYALNSLKFNQILLSNPSLLSDLTVDSLPVVHLEISNLETFLILHAQLTYPSSSLLFEKLLPTCSKSLPYDPFTQPREFTLALASSTSVSNREILKSCNSLHSFWKNCLNLEIVNEEIWQVLKFTYGILVGSLVMRRGFEEDLSLRVDSEM